MNAEIKTHHPVSRELFRQMLTRLQDEAFQRIKDLRRDQDRESEFDPADEIDSAHTTAEVETHAALIAREEDKLQYLDEALERLAASRYGRCLECETAIPVERLIAIPFASYCVDCQAKHNRTGPSWGEGTIIPPYDHQWTLPAEMGEGADGEDRSAALEEQLTVHRNEPFATEPEDPTKHAAAKNRISRRKKINNTIAQDPLSVSTTPRLNKTHALPLGASMTESRPNAAKVIAPNRFCS